MWVSEQTVARLGGDRDGIVRSDLAGKEGITASALSRLRRRGVLVRVGNGVDRLRDHPWTWRSRCRAALDVAGGGAVLGLQTAARLEGFYAYRDADDIVVLTRRSADHAAIVGRIVQTRWLPQQHVTEVDGLPVTTMARTFFDLCANPAPGLRYGDPYHERRMRQVYNDALARRGMTFTQEAAVLLVMAKRGRRGTTLTRRILLAYGPRHTPTRSEVETLFFELVRTYGLPEPERQVPISGKRGFIGTVDFAWRSAMLIVEVDSRWHDGPLDEEVDKERDALLREAGYAVERYRYGHIVGTPGRIHRELGAVLGGRPTQILPNS